MTTVKTKILQCLLEDMSCSGKKTSDIGLYLGFGKENHNRYSKDLNYLVSNNYIQKVRKKDETSRRGRGAPSTYYSLVHKKVTIKEIYNEFPELTPVLQSNDNVLDLIVESHPYLYCVGLQESDEEIVYDYTKMADKFSPFFHKIAKKQFKQYLMYSQQLFEVCLFNEDTEKLIGAFEDILSLVSKRDMFDPEFPVPVINKYTERGFLAIDVVFEVCLFVDMLKGNSSEEGIKFLQDEKKLMIRSNFKVLIQEDMAKSKNNSIKPIIIAQDVKKKGI